MANTLDIAGLADRRLNAKVELYDIITAVTQRAINSQFAAMYIVEPTLQQLEVKSSNGKFVIMSAELGPPKVSLRLGTNNKTVLFYLSLTSGWFEWFNQDERAMVKTEIKNWTLAFDVNLDMRQMENSSIPPNIVQALRDSGVGRPGDYTVKQLLIDFTTAKLSNYNEKESHLPGLDPSAGSVGEVASARVAFGNSIKGYLETIKLSSDGSGTTIAFIPEFTNPGVFHAPSIPPTAMRFQNYPFRATTGTELDAEGVKQGNNMLLYLEMTNHRSMPEQALNTTEPWVVPGPDNRLVDGCVALSKKIFLDEWLIAKLIALNWHTDITASYALCEPVVFHLRFGWNWVRELQPDVDYNFKYKGIIKDEAVYTFEHASEKIHAVNSSEYTQVLATVKNTVSIPLAPANGECVIKVSGSTNAMVGVNTLLHKFNYWGDMKWNAAFKFQAVADGGGLHVVMDPPIPNKPTISSGKNGVTGIWDGPEPNEAIKSDMSKFDVEPVLADLNNLFNGTWQFYFPGAGEFFFKNPVFNREADLMLELQYKGV